MMINVFMILVFMSINNIVANGAIAAPPPNPLPYYLYQLLTELPPSPLPEIFPMSDRDAADGFVHLARAINILPLAMKNYNYTVQLWALKLNYQWMRENGCEVKWDWSTSNSTIYPHLYGNTTKQMVVNSRTWQRKPNEQWNITAIADDTWLTDGDFRTAEQTMLFIPLVLLSLIYFIY